MMMRMAAILMKKRRNLTTIKSKTTVEKASNIIITCSTSTSMNKPLDSDIQKKSNVSYIKSGIKSRRRTEENKNKNKNKNKTCKTADNSTNDQLQSSQQL
jgi:hypothetical protein